MSPLPTCFDSLSLLLLKPKNNPAIAKIRLIQNADPYRMNWYDDVKYAVLETAAQ